MITHGLKPSISYNITTAGTSVAASAPVTLGIRVVRVVATTDSWIAINNGGVATTSSTFLPAKWPEYFQCAGNGTETVAAIDNGGTGTVNITEMTL
jgi:hypothetical protein